MDAEHNNQTKLLDKPKSSSQRVQRSPKPEGLSAFMAIGLTRGKIALVDTEDFEWLNQWRWYTRKDRNRYFYATRMVCIKDKWTQIQMHRLIMNAPAHLHVDHINFDGLDNRRQNLRLCTSGQNTSSRRPQRKMGTSIYKGVYWSKWCGKWRAGIQHNYKTISLGGFTNEIDAAKAYDKAARKYFGEFAVTNFYYPCLL